MAAPERVPPEAVEIIIRETYEAFPLGVDQPEATDEQRDAAFISCNAAGHALMNVTRRHQQTLSELQDAKSEIAKLKEHACIMDRADQLARDMRAFAERLREETAVQQRSDCAHVVDELTERIRAADCRIQNLEDELCVSRKECTEVSHKLGVAERKAHEIAAALEENALILAQKDAEIATKLEESGKALKKKGKDLDRMQAKHAAEVAELQATLSAAQDDLTLERLALERANDDLRISTDECKNVARKLFTVKAKYLETMRELQEVTEQHSDSLGYEKTKNLIAMLDAQTTKSIWYNKHVCGEDPSTSHLSAMLAYANETLQLAPSPDPNAMIRDLLTGSNNDTYRKALAKMSDTLLPTSPCFMAYKEFFAKIICHEDVDGSVIIRELMAAGSSEEHAQILDGLRLSILPETPGARCEYSSFIAFFAQLRLYMRLDGAKVATVYDAMFALRELVDRAATFRDDAKVAESRFANEQIHNKRVGNV